MHSIVRQKSPFLRTPAFIFCLPWGPPCGNHAKSCMNEKTIQCLPNPSQHVPIYLQPFPSYLNRKYKNRRFHVPQPTFLFPLEMSLRLSRNMLQHVPIYLQQFPSYSNHKCKNCRFHVPQPTLCRLHTWFHVSMGQDRLSALAMLHVHYMH